MTDLLPRASAIFGDGWADRRRVTILVLVVIGIALATRLYGLDWDHGFPYTPHPDERAILAKVDEISPPALGDLDTLFDADESPWNPRWFPYGSFPLYLLKGVQLISALGPGDGLTDLRITGRAISALADVGTVFLVFLLGRAVYGRRVGLLASLFAALAVIHIQLSHFFAVDTLVALFSIGAVYFLYRVARTGHLRDSVLAGALIGLGLATKVSFGPIYAAFLVAHVVYAFSPSGPEGAVAPYGRRWRSALRGAASGVAASITVLFIVQPYAFLDWSRFYDDVIEQSEMVRRIRDYPYTRQYIDTTPYWYHVQQLATWGLGWPLGLVAWAGLLYVSLRDMRLRYGGTYLAIGFGLPAAVLLWTTAFPAIFAASVISVAALLGTLPLRSPESRGDVLLLSWVVPSFLITGAFEVKFLRYLAPITPFLLLFGSQMLFDLWDQAGRADLRLPLRRAMTIGLVLLVGSTAFYAASYVSMYRETHTAVRASDWINRNVPKGSVILKEHWEEGIPNLVGYRYGDARYTLNLYENDGQPKVAELSDKLAGADYLVFFSNRLYGTIPRLPERYPISKEYYRLLFSGELGYELADFEATYPSFSGVSFAHDTFGRPEIPEPDALRAFRPAGLTLDLGFADESFSVYDHPTVLIFRNSGRFGAETIRQSILSASPSTPAVAQTTNGRVGLLLSAGDAETQQRGGTWTGIVRSSGWASRLPVLAWLVVVEGMALLVAPIAWLVFRPLPDRGYLFSKAGGLLTVGLVVWLLASLHWMAFSRASIAVAMVIVSLVSAAIIAANRREIAAFVRRRWSVLLIGELVFLVAFFAFLMVRMANPDLWHPFRGGEKPMDFAYLNAVLRSSYMPPYDPWFGGGFLNYYYWGQFLVAMLIKSTGIAPAVAFNLAVPLFFALTAGGAFAVVYNLAEGTRRRLRNTAATVTGPGTGLSRSPIVAGLAGALFVTVLGNLDGAIQVGRSTWRVLFEGGRFAQFDFWQSSRMMPPDPPGHEITEFPFFTFLFADLHAHMMALPFTLLAIGLAMAVVMAAVRRTSGRKSWSAVELVRLAALGIVVGSLRLLNAWDFPTYLLIGIAAVLMAEFFVHGGLGLGVLLRAGIKSVFVFAVGYLVFLPFHLTNETFVDGIERTTNTTVLWQFLAITGPFVFIIGSFFLISTRGLLTTAAREVWRGWVWVAGRISGGDGDITRSDGRPPWVAAVTLIAVVAGAVLLGYLLTAVLSADLGGSTIPFVAVLLALVLATGLRRAFQTQPDAPQMVFVALLIGVSLSFVIGLDLFRVEGDIDRMNSVFKFYLQIWVALALASAYLLWHLYHGRSGRPGLGKKVWLSALAVLLAAASIYPVLGTQDRLRDRFNGRILPLTLDGTAYIQDTVYYDDKGNIDLAADYEGIKWLMNNVQGSPLVLEGVTPTYRWGSRVSIYTGLPSVVGWRWHQQQQRWDYRDAVDQRIIDVNRIYSTRNPGEALRLIRRYGVSYVYVGQLERLYYPGGLEKFDQALGEDLDKVYENGQVAIYRVLPEPS